MTLQAKMEKPDPQRSPYYLIKNVEDSVIFPTWKVFNSDNVSIVSYKQEMRKSKL